MAGLTISAAPLAVKKRSSGWGGIAPPTQTQQAESQGLSLPSLSDIGNALGNAGEGTWHGIMSLLQAPQETLGKQWTDLKKGDVLGALVDNYKGSAEGIVKAFKPSLKTTVANEKNLPSRTILPDIGNLIGDKHLKDSTFAKIAADVAIDPTWIAAVVPGVGEAKIAATMGHAAETAAHALEATKTVSSASDAAKAAEELAKAQKTTGKALDEVATSPVDQSLQALDAHAERAYQRGVAKSNPTTLNLKFGIGNKYSVQAPIMTLDGNSALARGVQKGLVATHLDKPVQGSKDWLGKTFIGGYNRNPVIHELQKTMAEVTRQETNQTMNQINKALGGPMRGVKEPEIKALKDQLLPAMGQKFDPFDPATAVGAKSPLLTDMHDPVAIADSIAKLDPKTVNLGKVIRDTLDTQAAKEASFGIKNDTPNHLPILINPHDEKIPEAMRARNGEQFNDPKVFSSLTDTEKKALGEHYDLLDGVQRHIIKSNTTNAARQILKTLGKHEAVAPEDVTKAYADHLTKNYKATEYGKAPSKEEFMAQQGYEQLKNPTNKEITNGAYFKKDLANELEKAIEDFSHPEEFKAFLRRYDKMHGMFKFAAYTGNLGHFASDAIGNMWNMSVKDSPVMAKAMANRKLWAKTNHLVKFATDPAKHAGLADKPINVGGATFKTHEIANAARDGVLEASQAADVGEVFGGKLGTGKGIFMKGIQGMHRAAARNDNTTRTLGFLGYINHHGPARLKGLEGAAKEAEKKKLMSDAIDYVRETTFDYADLTKTEQHVFKRLMPFYTFMRKNMPYQMKQVLEHPAKQTAYSKAQNDAADQNGAINKNYLPGFLGTQIRLPFGNVSGDESGMSGTAYYLDPKLPVADLQKYQSGIPGIPSTNDFLAGVSPLLKFAVEDNTGVKVGANRIPTGESSVENFARSFGGPLGNNLVKQFGSASNKKSSEQKLWGWLSQITGMRVSPVDAEQMQKNANYTLHLETVKVLKKYRDAGLIHSNN